MASLIGDALEGYSFGLFLPFIIAAGLKTAQGSSTVAMVTTSTIVMPLLPQLGLDSTAGAVLTVMAIGSGAMAVSHANDSYFWVVSQFSKMEVSVAYRTHTVATLLQGVSTLLVIVLMGAIVL